MRSELVRSNFLSLGYAGVRFVSTAPKFFFKKKPAPDNSGAALTRQQVSWLADK
jgi:hypothetical protein